MFPPPSKKKIKKTAPPKRCNDLARQGQVIRHICTYTYPYILMETLGGGGCYHWPWARSTLPDMYSCNVIT